MPTKSNKYCLKFPCKNLAIYGGYCIEHVLKRAPKTVNKFYTSVAWRRLRNWYIKYHPLCEICEKEGRVTKAYIVDHKIEIKDCGLLFDKTNLQSLCPACHNRKTAAEKEKRNQNHTKSTQPNRLVNQTRAAEGENQFTHEIY